MRNFLRFVVGLSAEGANDGSFSEFIRVISVSVSRLQRHLVIKHFKRELFQTRVRWPIALRSKGKRLARLSGCQNFTAEIEELRSRFALGDILLALVIMTWGQRR
jgi:hypothetical protein